MIEPSTRAPTSETPFSDDARERQVLAEICAMGLKRAQSTIPSFEAIDWDRLVSLARTHRVVPIVWRALARLEAPEIPAATRRELEGAYRDNALAAMRATAHLTKIVRALGEAGIRALPLKGVCLAASYYGDVAGRHAGDIDILVDPSHFDRANEIVRRLGYLRISNTTRAIAPDSFDEDLYFRLHSMFASPDGAVVELHFRLHFNPAILRVDVDAIESEGARAKLGGVQLPVMPTDLQFVFLATHGARHEWERLQWIYDIAILVDRVSDAEIIGWLALADEYSLTNPVIQALILAHSVFDISLPKEIRRIYDRSLRIRYMVARAKRAVVRGPDGNSEHAEPSFKIGRRFYRMCVTGQPAYLWHEFRNGLGALVARAIRPGAVLA